MDRIFSQRIRNILEKDSLTLSYWFEDTIEILMSENKESKFLRVAYYALPILLVVYVLSIGPVYAIVGSQSQIVIPKRSAIFTFENYGSFYAPLIWAAQENSYIRVSLDSYGLFCYVTMYPDQYNNPILFY